jgi:hypothetical protein
VIFCISLLISLIALSIACSWYITLNHLKTVTDEIWKPTGRFYHLPNPNGMFLINIHPGLAGKLDHP